MSTIYAAIGPRGGVLLDTIGRARVDTEGSLFDYIAARNKRYESECWRNWEKGQRRAREMGYRIVRCRVVPMKGNA